MAKLNQKWKDAAETERILHVYRTHKDRVFRMLFNDKEKFLSLYNACNHTDYTNADDLIWTTLDNAFFLSMKNDASYLIDSSLALYEHQSTFTPNMPLRFLFYVCSQLQQLVSEESLYASTLVKIPTPQFIVFYNGVEEQPETSYYSLSDAYVKKTQHPQLELKVAFLNINKGKNEGMKEHCRTLKEYTLYVEKVRENRQTMPLDESVKKAVDWCIDNNILKEFMVKHKSEVVAMSIFEYNEEEEWRKLRKAEARAAKEAAEREVKERMEKEVKEQVEKQVREKVKEQVQEEREANISLLLETFQELGVDKTKAQEKLMAKFQLESDQITSYMEKYWKE